MSEVGGLVGGIVGGVAGFFIGGPLGASIGFAVGSMAGQFAGAAIEGPEQFRTEAQVPADLTFTQSTQGTPIKRVWGTAKLNGNIIHFNQFNKKVTRKVRSGGKGIGGSETTQVTYEKIVDIAIAFCEGPVELQEIWLDGDKAYSKTTGQNGSSLGKWRWYKGTETQAVDSELQTLFGANRVPAYRGVAYLVITGWNLVEWGNRLPNIRCVVTGSQTRSFTHELVPQVQSIPSGWSRPDESAIVNTPDGTGYYYILTNAANQVRVAKYSHALQGTEEIGAPLQWPELSGETALNILGDPTIIQDSAFISWGPSATGDVWAWECDQEHAFFVVDTTNNNAAVSLTGYAVYFNWRTGRGDFLRDLDGTLAHVGYALGQHYPPFSTGTSIEGSKIVWFSGLAQSFYPGAWDNGGNTAVSVGLLKGGDFKRVAYVYENDYSMPIGWYRRTALCGCDREFDVDGLSWHFYRIFLGSDDQSAVRMKYTIRYPFEGGLLGLNDPRNNSKFSYSPTLISNWGTFNFTSEQYYEQMFFDSATKNALVFSEIDDLYGTNFPYRLVDMETATCIDKLTGPQLLSLQPAYQPLGVTGIRGNVKSDPVYDPNGYWWIYPGYEMNGKFVAVATDSLQSIRFWDADWWTAAPNVYGWASYDWRKGALRVNGIEGGTNDVLLLLDRATPGAASIKTIVEDILRSAGLSEDQWDTTGLNSFPSAFSPGSLDGYIISRPTSAWDAIAPLAVAYGFYMTESEGKLKFLPKYGRTPILVNAADLGTGEDGEDAILFDETVGQISNVASSVTLNYIDKGFDYQQGSQRSNRRTLPNNNNVVIDAPIVVSPDSARLITERLLYEEWANRTTITFQLPLYGEAGNRYLQIEPGDIVQFDYADEYYNQSAELWEVMEIKVEGLYLIVTARGFENSFYNPASSILPYQGSGGGISLSAAPVPPSYQPDWFWIDSVALRPEDTGLGWYTGGAPQNASNEFRGISLYRSEEGVFQSLDFISDAVDVAVLTQDLPDFPWMTWDRGNVMRIKTRKPSLNIPSYTESQALEGDGAMLVGTEKGGWEVIQYTNATALGDGVWELSGLLRNRRGSSDTKPAGHSAYSLVIFVPRRASGLQRITDYTSYINQVSTFKPVGVGFGLGNTPQEQFTFQAISTRPRSPSSLVAQSLDGELQISWIRNDRLVEGWTDAVDLPNSEGFESYQIVISPSSGAATTHTASTTSLIIPDTYLRPLTISVAQRSSITGTGFASQINIQ